MLPRLAAQGAVGPGWTDGPTDFLSFDDPGTAYLAGGLFSTGGYLDGDVGGLFGEDAAASEGAGGGGAAAAGGAAGGVSTAEGVMSGVAGAAEGVITGILAAVQANQEPAMVAENAGEGLNGSLVKMKKWKAELATAKQYQKEHADWLKKNGNAKVGTKEHFAIPDKKARLNHRNQEIASLQKKIDKEATKNTRRHWERLINLLAMKPFLVLAQDQRAASLLPSEASLLAVDTLTSVFPEGHEEHQYAKKGVLSPMRQSQLMDAWIGAYTMYVGQYPVIGEQTPPGWMYGLTAAESAGMGVSRPTLTTLYKLSQDPNLHEPLTPATPVEPAAKAAGKKAAGKNEKTGKGKKAAGKKGKKGKAGSSFSGAVWGAITDCRCAKETAAAAWLEERENFNGIGEGIHFLGDPYEAFGGIGEGIHFLGDPYEAFGGIGEGIYFDDAPILGGGELTNYDLYLSEEPVNVPRGHEPYTDQHMTELPSSKDPYGDLYMYGGIGEGIYFQGDQYGADSALAERVRELYKMGININEYVRTGRLPDRIQRTLDEGRPVPEATWWDRRTRNEKIAVGGGAAAVIGILGFLVFRKS